MPDTDRTEAARLHDDHDLIDEMAAEAGGGQASRAGGRTATDVATRDELRDAIDPDHGITRPTGRDEAHPDNPMHGGHQGTNAG